MAGRTSREKGRRMGSEDDVPSSPLDQEVLSNVRCDDVGSRLAECSRRHVIFSLPTLGWNAISIAA